MLENWNEITWGQEEGTPASFCGWGRPIQTSAQQVDLPSLGGPYPISQLLPYSEEPVVAPTLKGVGVEVSQPPSRAPGFLFLPWANTFFLLESATAPLALLSSWADQQESIWNPKAQREAKFSKLRERGFPATSGCLPSVTPSWVGSPFPISCPFHPNSFPTSVCTGGENGVFFNLLKQHLHLKKWHLRKVSSGDVMPNGELSGLNKIILIYSRLYRDPFNNSMEARVCWAYT